MEKANAANTTKRVVPLKKLKIVEQKQSSTCGPAALRILLSYFGIDKSEAYLSRLCKTTEKFGTHPKMLVSALRKSGFKTKSGSWGNKKSCWKILSYWINKRELPVIVDWFSQTDGHYSVVIRLTKTRIWLADPEPRPKKERVRKLHWDDFFRVWFDFEGDYIRQSKDMEVRWWLAAYPVPLSRIKK